MPRFSFTKPKMWSVIRLFNFGKASLGSEPKVCPPPDVEQDSAAAARCDSITLALGELDDLDVLNEGSTDLPSSGSSNLPTYRKFVQIDATNEEGQEGGEHCTETLFEFPEYAESEPEMNAAEASAAFRQLSPLRRSCETGNSPYSSFTEGGSAGESSMEKEDSCMSDASRLAQSAHPMTVRDLGALAPTDLAAKHASLQRAMRYAEAQVAAARTYAVNLFAADKTNADANTDAAANLRPGAETLTFFRPFEFTRAMLEYRDAKRNVDAIRARLAAVESQAITVAARIDCWRSMLEEPSGDEGINAVATQLDARAHLVHYAEMERYPAFESENESVGGLDAIPSPNLSMDSEECADVTLGKDKREHEAFEAYEGIERLMMLAVA